jgi:hypothetical protein
VVGPLDGIFTKAAPENAWFFMVNLWWICGGLMVNRSEFDGGSVAAVNSPKFVEFIFQLGLASLPLVLPLVRLLRSAC